jgi:hypothetical protein
MRNILAACFLMLIVGCAETPQVQAGRWKVVPVQSIAGNYSTSGGSFLLDTQTGDT